MTNKNVILGAAFYAPTLPGILH